MWNMLGNGFRIVICAIIASYFLPFVLAAQQIPQQALDWQKTAQDNIAKKDIPQAISYYEQIVQSFPDTSYALDAKARIICLEIKGGQDDKAQTDIQLLQQKYSSQTDYLKTIQTIGDQYRSSRKRDEALALYQKSLEQFPGRKETIFLKQGVVEMCLEKKKRSSADAALESLMSQYSDAPGYTRVILDIAGKYRTEAKDYAKGRALYTHLLERSGGDENAWRCQNGIAKTYLEEGNLSSADREIDRLLGQYNHPDMVKHTVDLGWMYLKKYRKPDRSVELCNQLFEKFPDTSQTVRIQGLLVASSLQKGNDEQARIQLDVLVKKYSKEPDFIETVQAISKAAREYQQFAVMVQLQKMLLAKLSKLNEVIPEMADLAEGLILNGQYEEGQAVVEDMEKKFSGQPELGNAFNVVAHGWHKKTNYDKALDLFNKALLLKTSLRVQARSISGIAIAYVRLGDDAKVQKNMDDLLARFNDSPVSISKYIFNIGEEYYYMAEDAAKSADPNQVKACYEKALAVWQQFEQAVPNHSSPQCAYFSGIACQRLGQYEQAIAHFQRVISKWPNYAQTWHARYMIADCVESLAKAGEMDTAQANLIKQTLYREIIQRNPDCPAAKIAKKKIN